VSRADLDGLGYRGATVVLTGGASGMGEAATRILGELGANVHVADIAEPSVDCASFVRTDLSDSANVETSAKALSELGPVDYLLPVAGIPPHTFGPLHCMIVNYAGTRQFTELMLPAVRDGGAVGLIASTAGRNWQQYLVEHLETIKLGSQDEIRSHFEANPDGLRDGYSSSKELLIVWAQQVAIPLAQERRIRINCIAPCPVDTAFMQETGKVLGQAFIDNYPYPLLGRMPTAEEMAWSLLLLSSPLNAAVTGATLFSDQGYAGGLLTGALQPAAYTPSN
jgi:NAD(P)-dependent dehydrogenase (short-subunit alcohol dehydrogenase family)